MLYKFSPREWTRGGKMSNIISSRCLMRRPLFAQFNKKKIQPLLKIKKITECDFISSQ